MNFSSLGKWTNLEAASQSNKIKLGNYIQEIIEETISNIDGIKLLDKYYVFDNKKLISCNKYTKNSIEADLLFSYKKQIFYREIKCNVNLDTEKWKSTINKLEFFRKNLNANSAILCPPFYSSICVRKIIVEGMKNFFEIFNFHFSNEAHSELGNSLKQLLA